MEFFLLSVVINVIQSGVSHPLCLRYTQVYCPLGPGQPVSSGHTTDISAEGIQWAPYFYEGASNLWVMVGQKDENSGTTCYSHEELEGTSPEWGSTSDMPEIKKYIMCCVVDG